MGPVTVKFAELSVAPKGEPVGSKVKVPLIVSVPPPGTGPITDGEKVYVIGAAAAGDGVVRIAGTANTIATHRPSKLVSNVLRCCD
jgi:hypothetical protein